jgi:hypothetical protein
MSIVKDDSNYAESIIEYYAMCGTPELKEAAKEIVDSNIDLVARYGLSDEEYAKLTQPIRVY